MSTYCAAMYLVENIDGSSIDSCVVCSLGNEVEADTKEEAASYLSSRIDELIAHLNME